MLAEVHVFLIYCDMFLSILFLLAVSSFLPYILDLFSYYTGHHGLFGSERLTQC